MDRFLTLREVAQAAGISRSSIYRRVAEGTFPAPLKVGPRTSRWSQEEVAAWQQEARLDRESRALIGYPIKAPVSARRSR